MIEPGSLVPAIAVKLVTADEVVNTDSAAILSTGTVVFFTLPGAFTPTCHNNHLPGYIELADEILAAGADRIVCGTVNDHHVVQAWAQSLGVPPSIEFLADGNGELAKSMGLERDLTAGGLGIRFIRAAIIIDNGIIRAVFTEVLPGVVTSSGAAAILAVLKGD